MTFVSLSIVMIIRIMAAMAREIGALRTDLEALRTEMMKGKR